jgi:hypothetical protein
LLTGADFDIESIRKDKKDHLWFGEEFGPFLVEANINGVVLNSEVRTPNIVPPGSTATGAEVRSPQNPYLGTGTANLNRSNGFEGMAINPEGINFTLYWKVQSQVIMMSIKPPIKTFVLTSSILRAASIQRTIGCTNWKRTAPILAT